MKLNYRDIIDNKLSINTYMWPNNINPFQFIEILAKSGIKNIGLHTDFIEKFGVNKLKEELVLNHINVTSVNSVGYFTDPHYFKQNDKVLNFAKILNPEMVCVISGGIMGGPNPISNDFISTGDKLSIATIRKETMDKIILLFEKASKLNLILGLEPIGSWEILKKGHLNTISTCLKLIKNNNHKLIIDLYHSFADIDLDNFIKKSPKLGLLQFSNIKFDENFRPIGRKSINNINNINNLELSKYLTYVFKRNDNVKIEFEIFNTDIKEENPKKIIENLKNEILSMF
jgi:sugar phosphate isomerase/epimerase